MMSLSRCPLPITRRRTAKPKEWTSVWKHSWDALPMPVLTNGWIGSTWPSIGIILLGTHLWNFHLSMLCMDSSLVTLGSQQRQRSPLPTCLNGYNRNPWWLNSFSNILLAPMSACNFRQTSHALKDNSPLAIGSTWSCSLMCRLHWRHDLTRNLLSSFLAPFRLWRR